MTRVNSHIPVKNLTDQHLLAEHREIKRLPALYTLWLRKPKDLPDSFRLGTGHVLYLIDKGHYTFQRYLAIHAECKERGFKVTDYSENWNVYELAHYKTIPFSQESMSLIIDRITTNLRKSKQIPRYYGKDITVDEAIRILNQ